MKSTIFTHKWLKEKGNDTYTYVSIHVYTYMWMNEHYFITKHFPPSLLAQKIILAKKGALQLQLEVFPAMNNAISSHEQLGKTCARIKK